MLEKTVKINHRKFRIDSVPVINYFTKMKGKRKRYKRKNSK